MKGLIPCAGLGTRLHPLSVAVPKELLPVGGKPAVHHAVKDLTDSGVQDIVLVINRSKERIKDYLWEAFPISDFTFVIQDEPRGVGYAILESKKFLDGGPFVLLLPDNVFFGEEPLSTSLIREYDRTGRSCVTLFQRGKFKPGARFGFEVDRTPGGTDRVIAAHPVDRVPPESAVHFGPAALLLTEEIFPYLKSESEQWDPREGDFTERPALSRLIEVGGLSAAWVEGECFDIGTVEGYMECLRYLLGR
jgi:UTP-glucose-1-phosphate uridylyltransferase